MTLFKKVYLMGRGRWGLFFLCVSFVFMPSIAMLGLVVYAFITKKSSAS
ncbi:MAG TPA: hypothetical protein PKL13_00890 [bacterium]|nr:hypothetical protein [bacterium]